MSKSTTPRPDPLRDPIYLAVGRCLEKWSWVEENLALVLEGLVRHQKHGLLGTGFAAVRSFESKLNMVDEIAQRTLGKRRFAGWKSLYGKLDKKYRKRNQIAHFSIVLHGRTAPLDARLHPYWGISKGKSALKNKGLTAADLEGRAESFTRLSSELLQFHNQLPKRRRQWKAAPAPSS